MPRRLYGRSDWRLALAGITAGIGAFVLVIALWFTTRGKGPTMVTLLPPDTSDFDAGPVIGAFQKEVARRINANQPSTRALRGALRVNVREITWTEPRGATFARAAGATAALSTTAAARGDVLLSDLEIRSPEVFLRQAGPESWNFQPVFEELLNAPETPGPKRRIIVDGLRIAGGLVDVKRPADAFVLRDVEGLVTRLTLSSPGLAAPEMQVATVDALFDRPSSNTRLPLHAENAALVFPDGTAIFDVEHATVARTQLANVRGVWNPEWEGYAVQAEGDATNVLVADFKSFAPDRTPEDGTASFHFDVRPLAGDGTDVALTNLDFSATGASATGAVAFQIFPERFQLGQMNLRVQRMAVTFLESIMGRDLPYNGSVTGTIVGPPNSIALDLLGTLTAPGVEAPFTTRITGSIAMLESGLDVRGLTADLRNVPLAALDAFAPGLPLAGVLNGTIELNGSPARTPLELAVRLELGTGLATVNGMVDLTGALPRYDVTGRIIGVDLPSVIATPVPPVTFGGQFAIAGAGFKPDQIDARLDVNGNFTGWRTKEGDTVLARVRVRNATAEVDTLVATLATASIDAAGQWRFLEPLSGAVNYALDVSSLEPFGPYLPVIGDSAAAGSVTASGTISGSLSRLLLAGRLEAEEATSGGWSASAFDATYSVALGGDVPEVHFEGVGRGISTPTAGTYAVATLNGDLQPGGSFSVDLEAQRSEAAGAVALSATGIMPRTGARELFVRNAFFDLQDTRWQIARPARIVWGGEDGVRVDSLIFHSERDDGEVMIHGRIFPLARADFDARLAGLPVGDIQELVGRAPIVQGLAWADVRVRPPGETPTIDLDFRLENGAIQGIPVTSATGTLNYLDRRARARFTIAMDTAGSLDVDAALPVAIRLGGGTLFEVLDDGALTGTITAQQFSLAPIDSLITMVRGVTGQLNGLVTLGGTVAEPALNGDLALTGGNFIVPQLNQTYRDITGSVHFDGRVAEIQDVRAHSDGTATLVGVVTFERLTQPVFDLRLTLDGFRPLGVDNQPDAAVDGFVAVGGQLHELHMAGGVTVSDGYFMVPQFGADLAATYGDLSMAAPVLGQDFTPEEQPQWLRNLSIENLRVALGDGVWIKAREATLQLSGELTVNKRQDNYNVLGELEGRRGDYTLIVGPIVRRFDIVSAVVRFQGGSEMNPAIDVDARRIIMEPGGQRLNVDVHLGGTMRTPTISLASEDVPNIPESELISYLLFGRSSLIAGTDITQSGIASGTTEFYELIGVGLEQAVVGKLGVPLDVFQVRWGPDGPSLVLGRQLSSDFFLTFESGSTGLGGLAGVGNNTTTGGMNDWAVRLEWAFADQSSLQLGFEPVRPGSRIRGLGRVLTADNRQQLFAEVRRRWTW